MDAPAKHDEGAGERRPDALASVLRPLVGIVANVTALTALLVYFGWRRSETQSRRLGFDQSILGMSTQDYVMRSIGPVFWLLLVVGVVGLAGLLLEPRVTAFVRARSTDGGYRRSAVVVLVLLTTAWMTLPAAVWVMGFVWRRLAFILWPGSFGVGVLLLLYGLHLHRPVTASDAGADRRRRLKQAFGGLLVALSVFWMASNYAQVLGVRLADEFAEDMANRPSVVVTSQSRLHLDGPGVVETRLGAAADGEGAARYRYTGLRLLDHTDGKLFLVSDGWSRTYGVVFALDDDDTLRFDFVRDRRGSQERGADRVGDSGEGGRWRG